MKFILKFALFKWILHIGGEEIQAISLRETNRSCPIFIVELQISPAGFVKVFL